MENKTKSNIKLRNAMMNLKKPLKEESTGNQKIKNIKNNKDNNIQQKVHRPTSALANQNMNNFSHLFKNNNSNMDILWTLNLRQPDYKETKSKSKIEAMKEPSFYREDLEKYIKKKIKKSKSVKNVDLPSIINYSHLYKKKISDTHGTIINNQDLLYYELTLREHNLKNKKTNVVFNKYKWNNIIYTVKKDDLETMKYNNNNSSEKLKSNWLNDKYVNRPYKIIFKKVKYNGKSDIIKRHYIKDKNKAYNILGDTYSLKPYNDKYTEKNYKNIQDILNSNEKTQQEIWFQLGLRSGKKDSIPLKH